MHERECSECSLNVSDLLAFWRVHSFGSFASALEGSCFECVGNRHHSLSFAHSLRLQ